MRGFRLFRSPAVGLPRFCKKEFVTAEGLRDMDFIVREKDSKTRLMEREKYYTLPVE